MRTIIGFLFCGLLLFPTCILAQNATGKEEYIMHVEFEDFSDYREAIKYNVPIYYDDDDNEIKHGPFKINYKKDFTAQAGKKCILTYTASGNYVNGKLDGVFTVEEVITTGKIGTIKNKGTLNFANGLPTGTLTFSQSVIAEATLAQTLGKGSATITCSATIKDNKLVSYNDGEFNFNINDDGTFSGTENGTVYKNSINTNTLYLKTGKAIKADSTAQNLINAYIAGRMSNSDLIAKGFYLARSSGWIGETGFAKLHEHFTKLEINEFLQPGLGVHDVIRSLENIEIDHHYVLKRVNVISTEELIAKASLIKDTDKVYTKSEYISWYDTNDIEYTYWYNTNNISFSGVNYYFTDEAKQKLEEIIIAGIEEYRLKQERIAQEELKKKIQPICDFLVSEKSALSISYNTEVDKYFNPTGLSSTWQLDLKKKIKPFCKIADCKIFSCESKEDTIVAVLDITKYNKKGNITYRVPVTIVYGKILVTSIDFSNATIVE